MKKKFTFRLWILIALLSFEYQNAMTQNVAPFWSVTGNSNVSNTSKLGTTNASNLRLMTSNLERLTITAAGNVGIGTAVPSQKLYLVGNAVITGNVGLGIATPTYKLHVNGNAMIMNGLTVNGLGITVSTTTSSTGISASGASYGTVGYGSYAGSYGNGTSYGVYGYSSAGYGVNGYSGTSYGVYGNSEKAAAVRGNSSAQPGISGSSVNQVGVLGTSTNYHGGSFTSTKGYGMWAKTNATGSGSYAGVFEGNVYTFGLYQTSDQTLKKNIEKLDNAMDIISQLNPSYYEFKDDGKYASMHLPKGKHYGLLAQELEKILPGAVDASVHEIGDDKPETDDVNTSTVPSFDQNGLLIPGAKLPKPIVAEKKETVTIKAINYIELIPIMIKAIQEQQATISDLKEQIATLSRKVGVTKLSGAYMEQNSPNPFKGITTIRYSLPSTTKNASIAFANMKGQVIRTFTLGIGDGQVSLNRGTLPAGSYTYTLYVDGERVESKQMIIP